MPFLPDFIENRFTQRLKNSFCPILRKDGAGPIDLLYALTCEEGSLAKNILESNGVTNSKISKYINEFNLSRSKESIISADLKSILKRAAQKAASQNQPYIGTEHILYAVVEPLYTYYNEDRKSAGHESRLPYQQKEIGKALPRQKTVQVKKHLDIIFAQGARFPYFKNITKNQNYSLAAAKTRARNNAEGPEAKDGTTKQLETKTKVKQKTVKETAPKRSGYSRTPALDAFCENVSRLAQMGQIDPVIGRKKEIDRVLCILSRRTKNNPLLIGEPGVGKTAIVHGLAQRINNGEVPPNLLRRKIFALNLNSLVAGTIFRGDFELRMHEIMKESARDDVILFIDEIHTLLGAGSTMGTLDAANILKPALADGSLKCIGATTLDECKKYIEKDGALERRFQQVIVEEETEQQSIQTLSFLKKLYEKHHGVRIEEEAVKAAVELSKRYIQDRFLPDKAIDILDEAASRLKNELTTFENSKRLIVLEKEKDRLTALKEQAISGENYQDAIVFKHKEAALEEKIKKFTRGFSISPNQAVLTRRHIEETITEITGVPIVRSYDDKKFLEKLEADLNCEVIGQKEAISHLILSIKRRNAGLSNPGRPLGSFLFLGPSGVGKTALAKILAEKTSQTLITLNMAEYAEPHTISRIIGSPPGYIGYGEGGELTEKIRRNAYAVVLFDEIEKAHPQVHNILLSILENGILEDAMGKKVSFQNSTIILTSNAYTDHEFSRGNLGFSKSKETPRNTAKYIEGMRDALRPEIINRIDKVIVFNSLGEKEVAEITKLFIEKLKLRLPCFTLYVKQEAIDYIAKRAYKPGEGARLVRSTIEKILEGALAEHVIRHRDATEIHIEMKGGEICLS